MAIRFSKTLKSQPNKKGLHQVYIQTTTNKKVVRYSVPEVAVAKSEWNKSKQEIRNTCINKTEYDKKIDTLLHSLKKDYNDLIAENENADVVSVDDLKAYREKRKIQQQKHGLIEYIDATIEDLYIASNHSCWKKLKDFRGKLYAFLLEKKMSNVLLADVNTRLVKDFERYLQTLPNQIKKGAKLSPNSIKVHLKEFKSLINKAEADGLIADNANPFNTYKMPKEVHSEKEKLNINELVQLCNLEIDKGSLDWHVRNFFMFSFYCAGMRFEDVCTLHCSNIQVGNDGEKRIVYTMAKNNKKLDLPLGEDAVAIVAYYMNGKKKDDYLFPLLEGRVPTRIKTDCNINNTPMEDLQIVKNAIASRNVIINKALKRIAIKCGIEKNVSFHIARHTFASIARTIGVDATQIKGLLAHSTLQTSEGYMGNFATRENDVTLLRVVGQLHKQEEQQQPGTKQVLLEQLAKMSEDELQELLHKAKK